MKSPALITASLLAMIFQPSQTAKASDIGLDFSLSPPSRASNPASTKARPPSPALPASLAPLPIPAKAAHPPIRTSSQPYPPRVYHAGNGLGIAAAPTASGATLPPPPLAIAPAQKPAVAARKKPEPIALHFNLDHALVAHTPARSTPADRNAAPAHDPQSNPNLFWGGANSLVAKAIGSAEGTRTPEGHRTAAYYGHIDPGNRAWNLGTFSYQHGAPTPEEADERQLKRLQTQTQQLDQKANRHGLTLTLAEKLNGIDLANQAPTAALGRGGYLEWLSEARKLGMTGSDAILWSRTRAFLDPDTQRWNAPGLGNTVASISGDQERRMRAIARAMNRHQPQPTLVATAKREIVSPTSIPPSPANAVPPPPPKPDPADIIFSVSLQPPATATPPLPPASPATTPPLANQSPLPSDSSPKIGHQPSPPASATLFSTPSLDNRSKQTADKETPQEFPSFANPVSLHPPTPIQEVVSSPT